MVLHCQIQKGGYVIANSVDPDQTAPRSSLFWVCTVCSDLSVPILRIFTVPIILKGKHIVINQLEIVELNEKLNLLKIL